MAKFKLEDGTEIEAFTADEVKVQIDGAVKGLNDKVTELMDELKPAQRKAKELEDEKAELEKQRLEEQGNYKALLEKEREENRKKDEAAQAFKAKVEGKDIELALVGLTSEATKDTGRAKVLKLALAQHAKYGEEGVYYELNGEKVDKAKLLDHYKTELPVCFDGIDSSGGGATGGNGGAMSKKLSDMTATEEARFANENPIEYQKMIGD